MKTMITAIALIIFATATPRILVAHPSGEHGNERHEKHHDHGQCVRYEPRDAMPNLDEQPWEQIAVVGDFSFYRNTSRPELSVAAMKIQGVHPTKGLRTRISLQVGEEILTARIEIDEMICVRSVIADDGSRRDLAGLYMVLMKRLIEEEGEQ